MCKVKSESTKSNLKVHN